MANAAMILTTHVLDKLREAFQSIVEGTVMAAGDIFRFLPWQRCQTLQPASRSEGAASRPPQVREKASTDVA